VPIVVQWLQIIIVDESLREVIVMRDGRVREIVTRETFDNMLIREI
jgi:hypothetical protein